MRGYVVPDIAALFEATFTYIFVILVLVDASELILHVLVLDVGIWQLLERAQLSWLFLDMHLRCAIFATEPFVNGDLFKLADGACKAALPLEEELALIDSSVILYWDDPREVVELLVAFRVTLIEYVS